MVSRLEQGQAKTFVMMEYIIDEKGKPVYAKVVRGGNDDMNEKLETAFMGMGDWSPATHMGVKVPIKLQQTIMVEAGN